MLSDRSQTAKAVNLHLHEILEKAKTQTQKTALCSSGAGWGEASPAPLGARVRSDPLIVVVYTFIESHQGCLGGSVG